MMSTEAQKSKQQQQSTQQSMTYDERVFNERIRQLFNSIDTASVSRSSSPPSNGNNIGQMTSIVDALFPEQASIHQQQRDQRRSSTNDLTAAFDRFPLFGSNASSASAFCGGTSNGTSSSSSASAFVNRRQSTLHSSSRSLRNHQHHHHYQQQQQPHHYRPPPLTRPRFSLSTMRLQPTAPVAPAAAATTGSVVNGSSGLQRSSSSLSTTSATPEYQPRFASRLSTTRLPSVPPPVGSHDQIAGSTSTVDPIAPPPSSSSSSSVGVINHAPSASAVLARSTSSTNAQPQQFVTMTQTTTTTFCYVPASGSLAYNNLTMPGRSGTVHHHG